MLFENFAWKNRFEGLCAWKPAASKCARSAFLSPQTRESLELNGLAGGPSRSLPGTGNRATKPEQIESWPRFGKIFLPLDLALPLGSLLGPGDIFGSGLVAS